MKSILTITFSLLFFSQSFAQQNLFRNKVWYCAKYTVNGEIQRIDRLANHDNHFNFRYDFRNNENERGENYKYTEYINKEIVYSGKWNYTKGILTILRSGYPNKSFSVISCNDSNFLILQSKSSGEKYYFVSAD